MDHKFIVTPLSGSSELGLNATMLEHNGKIILINLGAAIAQQDDGQVELVIPNLDYLREHKSQIEGIFLTSAHADNIAGVAYAIEELGFPDIFASELTLDFLRKQLNERSLLSQVRLHSIKAGKVLKSDDLQIEFFAVAETYPESLGIYLHSPHQHLVYTNRLNWNQELQPGFQTDFNYLGKLGATEIDLLILGAANARRDGYTPTVHQFISQLRSAVMDANGRTIVPLDSVNLSCIFAIIKLAEQIGYKICLLGRPMQTAVTLAQKHELLTVAAGTIIHHKNINRINPKKLIVLTAGKTILDSEFQILRDGYQGFDLQAHDQIITGNFDSELQREMNARQVSIKLINTVDQRVVGYPFLAEQLMLISLLKPKRILPLCGEHADILQIAEKATEVIIPTNGDSNDIITGKVIANLPHTFTVVSEQGGDLATNKLKSERRALAQGLLVAMIRLNRNEPISLRDIHFEVRGLIIIANHKQLVNRWRAELITLVNEAQQQKQEVNSVIIEDYLRQQTQHELGKSPVIIVNIFR